MTTRLRSQNDYTQTIKLPEAITNIDTSDPVGAAAAASLIRNMRNDNYDNVGNLLTVASSVKVRNPNASQTPVVIGQETVTILSDPNNNNIEHELRDAQMVQSYLGTGMTIVRTEVRDVMG